MGRAARGSGHSQHLQAISLRSFTALVGHEPKYEAAVRRGRLTGVIAVDSAALVVMLAREPEADRLLQVIAEADRCFLSALSLLETSLCWPGARAT